MLVTLFLWKKGVRAAQARRPSYEHLNECHLMPILLRQVILVRTMRTSGSATGESSRHSALLASRRRMLALPNAIVDCAQWILAAPLMGEISKGAAPTHRPSCPAASLPAIQVPVCWSGFSMILHLRIAQSAPSVLSLDRICKDVIQLETATRLKASSVEA